MPRTRLDLLVKIARNNLLPARDRIVFFNDGPDFLPSVQAMFTPGHTKEHACFIVTSENNSLCLIGDLAHHPVLLPERPRSQFIYDLDPHQAGETRVNVLAMLSQERMTICGVYSPWPGIEHVTKEGTEFGIFRRSSLKTLRSKPGEADEFA